MDNLEIYKQFGFKHIASEYGDRLIDLGNGQGKVKQFHQGIDLIKEHNGQIPAFTDGKVLFAGFGKAGTGVGNYGNCVVIVDENKCVQVYGHLSEVKVKAGDLIKKGNIIGTQGNTGLSTGEHLHFEVRKKENAHLGWEKDAKSNTFNPTEYLKKFYSEHADKKQAEAPKPAPKKADTVKVASHQYKIKAGDTISSIAKEHGLTNQQLLKLNPQVTNPSKIKAGAVLNVK